LGIGVFTVFCRFRPATEAIRDFLGGFLGDFPALWETLDFPLAGFVRVIFAMIRVY
jgi:hypothetical protein